MIIKGTLKEIGQGFRQGDKKHYKYDYIIIGNHRINNITVPSFLEPKLHELKENEIEVSFYKGYLFWNLSKSNFCYKNER